MLISRKGFSSSFFWAKRRTFSEFFGRADKTSTHMSGWMFFGNVKFFLKRTTNFFSRLPAENFSVRWRTFLGRVVKTRFWVSRGTFGGKQISPKKLSHIFWPFNENFLGGFSKKISKCPEQTVEQNFCEKYFSSSFHHIEPKKPTFSWIFQTRLPKRHFTCPKKTFEEKRSLLRKCNLCIIFGFSAKKLGLLPRKSRQGCRNTNPHVRKNVLRKY